MIVTDRGLAATFAWLHTTNATPIPPEWVEGALEHERRALGALASICAHALGGHLVDEWDPAIRDWLSTAEKLPADVLAELSAALSGAPDRTLADLYAGLVASPRRRVLGTFFTPVLEATSLLDLWDASQSAPTNVVDVGAGVGVFTAAAARRWEQARVAAVDVNPVTLGLLGARMAQPDAVRVADRVDLILEDFTTWLPRQRTQGPRRRLILGNPPYTRAQLIPTEMRSRLSAATADLCGSRASLSAYITALALQSLDADDGLCLLLPAQWLEADYAAKLRHQLMGTTNRRVDLRLVTSDWFSDATVDAVILLVGVERGDVEPFTVGEWGSQDVHLIDREDSPDFGWRHWFSGGSVRHAQPVHAGTRTLGEIAQVRRGTATGANDFFLLSDAMVADHALPDEVLVPVVRRLSDYPSNITQTGFDRRELTDRVWMFVAGTKQADDPAVAAYVAHGVVEGIDDRYLCRVRTGEWYDVRHDLFRPDVIVTAMTRGQIRVVQNHLGAAITNNLYGWTWRPGAATIRQRRAIVEWLRGRDGQRAVLAAARTQGDGLYKIEPRALAGLHLPPELFSR